LINKYFLKTIKKKRHSFGDESDMKLASTFSWIKYLYATEGRLKLTLSILAGVAFGAVMYFFGFNFTQIVASVIFLETVLATLLFWRYRLIIATIGVALFLATKTLDVKHMLEFMHFDVILFLIGMMVVVAYLKESGFFRWIAINLLKLTKWEPTLVMIVLMFLSAIFAALVDEVTSILIIMTLIFEICKFFQLNPVPFIISAVFATNIGSSATLLGNPVGILIAFEAGLTFWEFARWATPIAILCVLITIFISLKFFKLHIEEFREKIKSISLTELEKEFSFTIDKKKLKISVVLFISVISLIATHSIIETLLDLEKNAMLLIASFLFAGIVFLLSPEEIAEYVEKHIEWRTLLFFMLLFAKAGALSYVGLTKIFAEELYSITGGNYLLLLIATLYSTTILSGFIDNVPVVATLIPVVKNISEYGINPYPFWWALLYAGTYGGNLTMVASTANIVSLGMLDKEFRQSISLSYWLKIGVPIVLITITLGCLWLLGNIILFPY